MLSTLYVLTKNNPISSSPTISEVELEFSPWLQNMSTLLVYTGAEAPILWPLDAKNWLIGKDPDAGKDWGQEEKGMTEDEMAGWHHRLNGHEFEQASGVADEQESLSCCSPWGWKEPDMTGWLNWTDTASQRTVLI